VTQQENDIAAVATKVGPSVVSIVTSTQVTSYYYGDSSQEAAGTGIVVSANGYIMTNNHVIDGATKVTAIDSDGNQYADVSVIGRDPLNDVAFLKVTSDKKFTPAEIGDSSTVRTGQQVVAIGNALGQYQNSVTSGILSGTGRPVAASNDDGSGAESLTDLLQTDASINPGNSGGPLLNLAGQVIGINTAVASNADNIGFAIPINATKGVLAGVIANDKVQRAYLGVGYLSIVPEVAKEYNLSVKKGAYVYASDGNAIAAGSPADKAGLKKGDIIQKIGDETIGEQGGLSTILGQYKPGDKVKLTILRDGKTITVQVTLGTYGA
jgi:serine protease Do